MNNKDPRDAEIERPGFKQYWYECDSGRIEFKDAKSMINFVTELDTLRARVEELEAHLKLEIKNRDERQDAYKKAAKERDELRHSLDLAQSALGPVRRERNELREKLAEAEQAYTNLRNYYDKQPVGPKQPTIVKSMWQRVTSGPCFGDAKDMEIARLRAELESLRPKPVVSCQYLRPVDCFGGSYFPEVDTEYRPTEHTLKLIFHDGKLVSAEVIK